MNNQPSYAALTKREANYLNNLGRSVEDYKQALHRLQGSLEHELSRLGEGLRTDAIGSQRLMDVATREASLRAILDSGHVAREMEDRDAWDAALALAYTGKVSWFTSSVE
jgi:hypothetical protein